MSLVWQEAVDDVEEGNEVVPLSSATAARRSPRNVLGAVGAGGDVVDGEVVEADVEGFGDADEPSRGGVILASSWRLMPWAWLATLSAWWQLEYVGAFWIECGCTSLTDDERRQVDEAFDELC